MRTVGLACAAGLLLVGAASPALAGKGVIKTTSNPPPSTTSVSTVAQPCTSAPTTVGAAATTTQGGKSATDAWSAQTRCASPPQGGAQSGAPASTVGVPSMDASSKDSHK